MRKICLTVLIVSIVLSASLALAGQPFGNNWGKWGPKDELGALNYITPEKIAGPASS